MGKAPSYHFWMDNSQALRYDKCLLYDIGKIITIREFPGRLGRFSARHNG